VTDLKTWLQKFAVNLHTKETKNSLKRICLFVILFLITSASIHAQQLNIMGHQQIGMSQQKMDSLKNIPIRLIAPDNYTQNLAFFCKKEIQMEKITKIPFKFRLGNIDYVDRLEGKHANTIQKSIPVPQ
jgi:hypothetical protein